jgi:hypothetical protein
MQKGQALLGSQELDRGKLLQRQFGFVPVEVQQRLVQHRRLKAQRMMELFSQIRRLAGARQRGIGEAQDPFDLATDLAGADPGIMAAKQQTVRAMRLDIVKPPAGFAMLAPYGRLAAEQAGSPGTVMRLQAQPAIGCRRGGQREQFARERA